MALSALRCSAVVESAFDVDRAASAPFGRPANHRHLANCNRRHLTTEATIVRMAPVPKGGSQQHDEEIEDAVPVPPLRFLGDERLMQSQPSVPPDEIKTDAFRAKLDMLKRAMGQYGGIGIAGPQVGWWTRVFCFGIEGTNPRYPAAASMPLTFWINPEISWSSDETNWMWEGCLSVPGMRGWVERPTEVVLTGLDEKGEPIERKLTGLAARVAQHELDHLDGVLFPQLVPGSEFLLPQASMDAREGWAKDWPSPGSCKTLLGDLCDEK